MSRCSGREWGHWRAVGLFLVLWISLAIASYFLLVVPRQHRFDFYPRWVGARAVLAGENPYSQEVTWRIQEGMFDRRLEPWEDQQRFAYSAVIVWLLISFWLLPFPLAASLWCGLQLLLLLSLPLWVASLLGWRLRPLNLAVLLLFSALVYRYPINAYLLGQFIPFSLACLVLAWHGLVQSRPVVTALALLGVVVRPEVVLVPLLVLLLVAWDQKQRWVVVAWAGVLGFLWLLTRAWIGPWVPDFLAGIGAYAEYSFPRWPPLAVGSEWLAVPITLGVLAWGVWMWLQVRFLPVENQVPWVISVAILVTLTVLPQTNNYTLILGLLPAWVVLWASVGWWLDWLMVLAVLTSPWVFWAANGNPFARLEQLLIPLALGVLLTLKWRTWRRQGRGGHLAIPMSRA